MGTHVGPLLAVALGVFGARCREAPITAPRPITSLPRALDAGESSLIGADNRFAFKLFGEIARQASPDSNLFISPLSAAMALGMAYDGAAGSTQAEMQRALELTGRALDYVVAYLINAIYFKGDWTIQFDPARTKPGPFTLANGAQTSVPMMTHGRTVTIGLLHDGDVTVLDLPYSAGAFTMTIALPHQPGGIDSLVAGLTEERWNRWTAALDSAALEVHLPKFTLAYALTMNAALKALGMPSAFCDSGHGDFARMNPTGQLGIKDVRP